MKKSCNIKYTCKDKPTHSEIMFSLPPTKKEWEAKKSTIDLLYNDGIEPRVRTTSSALNTASDKYKEKLIRELISNRRISKQEISYNDNIKNPLTFDELHKINAARCNADIRPLNAWTPLEWGGCIAGETGELCNYLKKMKRGDKIDKKVLAHELADIVSYADLLASLLDIDLGEAIREKFNIVSKRWNSKYKL